MGRYPERFKFKFTGAVMRPDNATADKVYEAVQHNKGSHHYYKFIDDTGNWDTNWLYTPDPAQLGPYGIELVNDQPKEETLPNYPESFKFKFIHSSDHAPDTTVGKVYTAHLSDTSHGCYGFEDDDGFDYIDLDVDFKLGTIEDYPIEIVNDQPKEEPMPKYWLSINVVFTEDIPDTYCVIKGKKYRCELSDLSSGLYDIYDGDVVVEKGWLYDEDSGTLGGYGVRVVEDDQSKTTPRTKHIDVLTAYLRNKESCLRVEYPGGRVVDDYQCLVIPGDDCIVELITDKTQVKRCQLQSQLNSLHTEFNKEKQRLQSELAALTEADND